MTETKLHKKHGQGYAVTERETGALMGYVNWSRSLRSWCAFTAPGPGAPLGRLLGNDHSLRLGAVASVVGWFERTDGHLPMTRSSHGPGFMPAAGLEAEITTILEDAIFNCSCGEEGDVARMENLPELVERLTALIEEQAH